MIQSNMTHPPQEILIKVPCSDRLPENTGYYHAVIKESEDWIYFNHITEYWYHSKYEITHVFPSHWYEPATRVVLTVEEYESLKERHRKLGYLEAREDMDDERDADDLY